MALGALLLLPVLAALQPGAALAAAPGGALTPGLRQPLWHPAPDPTHSHTPLTTASEPRPANSDPPSLSPADPRPPAPARRRKVPGTEHDRTDWPPDPLPLASSNGIQDPRLSEPKTKTWSPLEPNTSTLSPSEPNTKTGSPSELKSKTWSSQPKPKIQSPSGQNIKTQPPSGLKTETQSPSEPNAETQFSSEPKTQSPLEPNTETQSVSEPNTKTRSSSEPHRETSSPLETRSPLGPNIQTQSLSELNSGSSYLMELNRTSRHSLLHSPLLPLVPSEGTENPGASDITVRRKVPVTEPYWSETGSPSDPERTESSQQYEPNPESRSPPGPVRWESGPSILADTEEARTLAVPAQMGHWTPYTWDNVRIDGRTSSASGITPKSVTRRHISKRTPHMDITGMSTTFPQDGSETFSSMTNGTSMSNITETPASYTTDLDSDTLETGSAAKDFGNTSRHSGGMTQVSVTGAKDSGNTTQDSVAITQDSGNSTETSRTEQTASESEPSAPMTYPLQTPSYLATTYPTPHHMSESATPFTSIPATIPNMTSDLASTIIPLSKSTVLSSSNSSSSDSGPSTWTLTSPVSSSEQPSSPYSEVNTHSNQSSSDISSSSPIASTLVAFPFSTSSISPSSEVPPQFTSTKSSEPMTTLPTTAIPPSLSSLPSLPPSSHPAPSTSATETSTTYRTSSPPTGTDDLSGGLNSSSTGISTSSSVNTVEVMTSTLRDLLITARSVPETQTAATTEDNRRTPNITDMPHLTESPNEPTNPIPTTTSNYNLIPSPLYSTPGSSHDILETTRSHGSAMTTGDPNKQVTTDRASTVDDKTVTLRLETTASTKGKKRPPQAPSPPGVATVRYPAMTPGQPPAPATPTRTGPPAPAADLCSPNPCLNGGVCMERSRHKGYRCECPAAWQGRQCDTDVNECLSSPCPAQATCINHPGSFSCRCPLGYIMERGTGCIQVRTFLGHIEVPRSFLNGSRGIYSKLQEIEEEIVHILNSSFSSISGYHQSSVINSSYSSRIVLSVQNTFLLSSNVTIHDLKYNIQRYIGVCRSAPEPSPACRLFLHPKFSYIAVSLCSVKNLRCDNETSECGDPGGIASCQCKAGYFKYSKMDHSCRACDDGYKLQEGACVRCPFGLGGFNCSNPYQLITVIIAAAGGGLLLILGVALAVTCCRKSKHDISKLIFKSGDFQMSPYAEYPKTQRSAEWGRETIEMQENGSTKNLLQMTDVYYSPGLRNSEMERNGLYPYTGLPGSRHSCIYPGQYNPSFINEENRRRDYF